MKPHTRSNAHDRKGPFRVIICLITLWSFLFNVVGLHEAWGARTPLELSSVHSNRPGFPSALLDIDTFVLPVHLGQIKDRCAAGSDRIIIHVQDAHCNYAAQHAIAKILGHLNKEYGIDIVNLEGGAGGYDLSIFTRIQQEDVREKVADYFVKEGLVNGAEYFAINNPEKITLQGVEDPKLYLENLNIYRESLQHKETIEKHLKELTHLIGNLKNHIYSKELLELDEKYAQFKSEAINFRDYLTYLVGKASQKKIDITPFANIGFLNKALEQEKTINFKKANYERAEIIERLEKTLSKHESKELVLKTLEYKSERILQTDFYSYLITKAKSANLEAEDYPELQKYIAYISTYNAIDKPELMGEIENLEEEIKASLYKNDKQKELSLLAKNLILLENIFNIHLTKDDYKYYIGNKQFFSMARYISFINREAPLYHIRTSLDDDISILDEYRENLSRFYEYSFKRDQAFLNNLQFSTGRQQIVTLVTGGFHTENLCQLFKENDISYISIAPNFRNEDGYECPYFRLLAGVQSDLLSDLMREVSAIALFTDFCNESGLVNGEMTVKARMLWVELVRWSIEGKDSKVVGNRHYSFKEGTDLVAVATINGRVVYGRTATEEEIHNAIVDFNGMSNDDIEKTYQDAIARGDYEYAYALLKSLLERRKSMSGKEAARLMGRIFACLVRLFLDRYGPIAASRDKFIKPGSENIDFDSLLRIMLENFDSWFAPILGEGDLSLISEVQALLAAVHNLSSQELRGQFIARISQLVKEKSDVDFGIAGDNLGGADRSAHEYYHRLGMFADVIADIAKQIGAGVRSDGRFDLRFVVERSPNKRIKTTHGEIYITDDGILVIIDSRFQKNHAGRDEFAVYAATRAKAEHEITELMLWAEFAQSDEARSRGLHVTAKDIRSGLLGRKLREWMNDSSVSEEELSERQALIRNKVDQFHAEGLAVEERANRKYLDDLYANNAVTKILRAWITGRINEEISGEALREWLGGLTVVSVAAHEYEGISPRWVGYRKASEVIFTCTLPSGERIFFMVIVENGSVKSVAVARGGLYDEPALKTLREYLQLPAGLAQEAYDVLRAKFEEVSATERESGWVIIPSWLETEKEQTDFENGLNSFPLIREFLILMLERGINLQVSQKYTVAKRGLGGHYRSDTNTMYRDGVKPGEARTFIHEFIHAIYERLSEEQQKEIDAYFRANHPELFKLFKTRAYEGKVAHFATEGLAYYLETALEGKRANEGFETTDGDKFDLVLLDGDLDFFEKLGLITEGMKTEIKRQLALNQGIEVALQTEEYIEQEAEFDFIISSDGHQFAERSLQAAVAGLMHHDEVKDQAALIAYYQRVKEDFIQKHKISSYATYFSILQNGQEVGRVKFDENQNIIGISFTPGMYPPYYAYDDRYIQARLKLIEQLSQEPFFALFLLNQIAWHRESFAFIPRTQRENVMFSFDSHKGESMIEGETLGGFHHDFGILLGLNQRIEAADRVNPSEACHEFHHFWSHWNRDSESGISRNVKGFGYIHPLARFFRALRGPAQSDVFEVAQEFISMKSVDKFIEACAAKHSTADYEITLDLVPIELRLGLNDVLRIGLTTKQWIADLMADYARQNGLQYFSHDREYMLDPKEWIAQKAQYYLTLDRPPLMEFYKSIGMEDKFLSEEDLKYFRERYGEISYWNYQRMRAESGLTSSDSIEIVTQRMREIDTYGTTYSIPSVDVMVNGIGNSIIRNNLISLLRHINLSPLPTGEESERIATSTATTTSTEQQVVSMLGLTSYLRKNTADIIVMPGSQDHKGPQYGVSRQIVEDQRGEGLVTIPLHYSYTADTWQNTIGGFMLRALDELTSRLDQGDDTARVLIYAPEGGREFVNDILAQAAFAPHRGRFSIVDLKDIQKDGVINVRTHITLAKALLNYERGALGEEGETRLANFIKTVVANSEDVDGPEAIKAVLSGALSLRMIAPQDFSEFIELEKAYREIERAL